jgi:hypothetical protein
VCLHSQRDWVTTADQPYHETPAWKSGSFQAGVRDLIVAGADPGTIDAFAFGLSASGHRSKGASK